MMESSKTSSFDNPSPMLIIFGGLPAAGKTTIAKELARQIGATYLRIDTIEQAISDFATMRQPITDEGYRVAYAVAEDNLRLGRTVISDSVNPIQLSRDAWIGVAHRAHTRAAELRVLPGHTVITAQSRGWDRLNNGTLLNAAEEAALVPGMLPSISSKLS
jgi:predicted kinase